MTNGQDRHAHQIHGRGAREIGERAGQPAEAAFEEQPEIRQVRLHRSALSSHDGAPAKAQGIFHTMNIVLWLVFLGAFACYKVPAHLYSGLSRDASPARRV